MEMLLICLTMQPLGVNAVKNQHLSYSHYLCLFNIYSFKYLCKFWFLLFYFFLVSVQLLLIIEELFLSLTFITLVSIKYSQLELLFTQFDLTLHLVIYIYWYINILNLKIINIFLQSIIPCVGKVSEI